MKYWPPNLTQASVKEASSTASIFFSSFTHVQTFDSAGFSSLTMMLLRTEFSTHLSVTYDIVVPIAYGTYYSSTHPISIVTNTILTSTIEVTDASPTYTTCAEATLTSTTEVTDADPTYTTCVEETLTSTTEVTDASPTYTTCVEVSITDASPTYTECSTYTACSTYTECSTYAATTTATSFNAVVSDTTSSPTSTHTTTAFFSSAVTSFSSGTVEIAYLQY